MLEILPPHRTLTRGLARWSLAALLAIGAPSLAADEPEEPPVSEDPSVDGSAAESEESSEEVPERLFDQLLVIGSPAAAREVAGSAHYLTKQDLERQDHSDVHRILRQVPGLNIQEEDGYGLRPNIGIRGTGVDRSQKITLLEDGVLIAPAPYSAPSAYYSPTAGRMESVEVRKGSGAIRQGPYTNGGAVNYVSTSIPGSLRGRFDLASGADDLRRAHAWLGDSGDTFGWLLETYQLETDGFKELDGGGGTGFELADYLAKLRFHSRPGATVYQAVELKLGKTEQDGDETYLGLTQSDFERDPYRRYASSAGDNITSDHEQAQLSYFVQPHDRISLTATAYRNDFFRNWYKLESVRGISVSRVLDAPRDFASETAILRGEVDSDPGALAVRNNRRSYYSHGLQAVVAAKLGAATTSHELEVGVRYHEDAEDRFQEEDLLQMVEGRRVLNSFGAPGSNANRIARARATALFVQDTLTRGPWTLTPGFRVESIDLERLDYGRGDPGRTGSDLRRRDNDLTEIIPGVGVAYRLGPSSRSASLFAGVHRGFSPPSPSSTQEVEAEESLNWELGWRHQKDHLNAELVGFFNDYENLLGNDTLSTGGPGTGDQFNAGEVRVSGLEAGLGMDLGTGPVAGSRLPLRLTYTYTHAEFRSSFASNFADWAPSVERGDELPYVPRHQLYAGLSLEGPRWSVHVDGNYTAAMRTHAGSGRIPIDEEIGARLLFDLKTEYRLQSGLSLWGQLLNVTDEVYVAARRPAGLRPGRPRAALFGLGYAFAR